MKSSQLLHFSICYLEPSNSSTDVVTSIDGTTWRSQSLATARVIARNILHQQGGTKQFIRVSVDAPSNIFFKVV